MIDTNQKGVFPLNTQTLQLLSYFTFGFVINFPVLAHIQYVELVIVSSILYFVRGIYAHVVGGVGTCTRACSCACTTCTTAS